MKILVVRPGPKYSVDDVANGWVKGLRHAGHDVIDWDLGQRMQFFLEGFMAIHPIVKGEEPKFTMQQVAYNATAMLQSAVWEYKPDVILLITGFWIPPSFYELARRDAKVVLMVTESPYEDDRQIPQSRFADMVVVNDTKNLHLFEEQTRAFYYGHGYDEDIHRPGMPDPELVSEFCFVGTGFPERIEFFEQVDFSETNAVFAGAWQGTREDSPIRELLCHDINYCFLNKDTVRLYQSSLASANIYRQFSTHSSDGNSCGPREIEMAATGLFFLREHRPESDELFPMLPTFEGPQDFQTQLAWWLSHPDERQQAALQARDAVKDREFNVLAEAFTQDLQTL